MDRGAGLPQFSRILLLFLKWAGSEAKEVDGCGYPQVWAQKDEDKYADLIDSFILNLWEGTELNSHSLIWKTMD